MLELAFDEVPPTPPDDGTDSDDAFLAELRKAMADDSPLGPRDDDASPGSTSMSDDDDEDRKGWRFGKRR